MTYHTKKKFFTASRLLLWLCLAAVSVYVVVSVLFYFIGEYQFEKFQDLIKSHPIVYAIPVLLVISLIGSFLFKQDEDDEPEIFERRRKPSYNYVPVFSTIILGSLVAIALYSFVFKNPLVKSRRTAKNHTDSLLLANSRDRDTEVNTPLAEVEPKNVVKPLAKKDTLITAPKNTSSDQVRISSRASVEKPKYTSLELKYKVISKAYLYNAPIENTKRNSFINASNSNNTLLPKNELNGFIYVVFTNEKGQTTMGWLNKKDLRPVNELVYNSSK